MVLLSDQCDCEILQNFTGIMDQALGVYVCVCVCVFSSDVVCNTGIHTHVSNNMRRHLHCRHCLHHNHSSAQHSLLERTEEQNKQFCRVDLDRQITVTGPATCCQQTDAKQRRQCTVTSEIINSCLATDKRLRDYSLRFDRKKCL